MFRRSLTAFLLMALVWTAPGKMQGQEPTVVEITFERAMSLARRQAPALAVTGALEREAESRLDAAGIWRFNPQVSGSLGPRIGSGETALDWSVAAQQWFELGGQSGDRETVARQGVARAEARSDDVERELLRDVAIAFSSVLYWKRRVVLAEENVRIAHEVVRVASRRHEVGDVGGLEQAVAELSELRARSGGDRSRVALLESEGRLKMLLGIPAATALQVHGDLRELGLPAQTPGDTGERADVRVLRAAANQARAEVELANGSGWPNFALGANYASEEGDHVIRGTLTLELPIFDHGQGAARVAEAREELLQVELESLEQRIGIESQTRTRSAEALGTAVRQFEEVGLESLERAEHLAAASYAAGAIPLGELLALRRELMQAKFEYVELLLGAATARAELVATTRATP